MSRLRAAAVWAALGLAVAAPVVIAAASPLLAYRDPVYVVAGFAGIAGLAVMLVQPLLAAGALPGVGARAGRRVHAWIGAGLVTAICLHVAGLWITSPPDVIDALLFRSPTPFSAWGVVAMWAAFAAALVAATRNRFAPRHWRPAHTALVTLVVTATVVHALLIQGAMGTVSKVVLCGLVVAATGFGAWRLRSWAGLRRARHGRRITR